MYVNNKMKADCVRKVSNWSNIKPVHKFEKSTFNKDSVLEDIPITSPKMKALLEKINQLDEEDMKREGKLFKHFIFSDVKQGGYGAKIIASSLIASGYNLVYNRSLKLASDTSLLKSNGTNFALLCSTSIYDKPIQVKL